MRPNLTITREAGFLGLGDDPVQVNLATFGFDGVPLKSLLLKETGETAGYSLPSFQAPLLETVRDYSEVFLNGYGYQSGEPKEYEHLAPVLACDCGIPHCGGVWTRIFASKSTVFWSGFWYYQAGITGLHMIPIRNFKDGRICCDWLIAFDRQSYAKTFKELLDHPL